MAFLTATSSHGADGPARPFALYAAALLMAVASLGAAREVRRLDSLETLVTLDAPSPAAWRARGDGGHELPLGAAVRVPARGLLRVRACAEGAAERELWLEARGAAVRERLTHDRSLARRCTEAQWRTREARRVEPALVVKGAPAALSKLTLRVGGAIEPRDLWPALLFALGVGLAVLGPSLSRRARAAGDEGEPYRAPAERTPPPQPPPELPWFMRGVGGFALAAGALLGVNVVAQAPVLLGGLRGSTLLAATLLQQSLLALAAAAMLGAFGAPSPRAALELGPPPKDWFRRALAAASVLLVAAMGVALLLEDAGDSPIGRAVDAMPTRYVIAFGALCAPLPEELFFRGLLGRLCESAAGARRGPAVSVLAPAAVFTAMHALQLEGARLGLVPIAALGLANGWLRWSTRGLAAPWAVHTLYNGVLALSALA